MNIVISRPSLAGLILLGLAVTNAQPVRRQVIVPPLDRINEPSVWRLVNRRAAVHEENGRTFVRLENNTGIGDVGDAWLIGSDFKEGVIEADLRGRDLRGQSFVGISFRRVDDNSRDTIYFRPFNFRDPERRGHSVQYASDPDFTWPKLRANSPGKYEAAIDPAPDPNGWFHVRIVVENRVVSVFVNGAEKPALVAPELTQHTGGLFGLGGTNADYANLKIIPKQQ
jgi:hypothetical protein